MEYENMEDPEQRREEMHRFSDLFLPAQKKYGLTASCRTSLFHDSSIRIWQGEGKDKQLIIKVENASEARCYALAAEDLRHWMNKKKEQNIKMPKVC